jgi:hypothetical protein
MWFKRTFAMPMNRWYHSSFGTREFNEDGVDIFDEDWDNLFILDACRYDTFERIHDLPGTLSKRESRASTTPEFIRANIHAADLSDTVYVTSTPQIHNHDDIEHSFHRVVDVWDEEWDDELGTVPPDATADAAADAHGQHPNKRLLVHFLQPHYPFIGEVGQEHFNYEEVSLGTGASEADGSEKFWDTVGTVINDVSEDIVWEAYEENLRVTLPHVERLLTRLGGKTVVTADHGEMIYDRAWPVPIRINGHPGGLYTPELVDIPWHTYTNGPRRRITAQAEAERESTEIDDEAVEERLRDLGYA